MASHRRAVHLTYYVTAGTLSAIITIAVWGWSSPIALGAGVALAFSAGRATETVVDRVTTRRGGPIDQAPGTKLGPN